MKILAIYRYTHLDQHGGTYSYIHGLNQSLVQRGHEVYWVARAANEEASATVQVDSNYWIHRINIPGWHPLLNSWRLSQAIEEKAMELHRERPFDVVCLHSVPLGYRLRSSVLRMQVPFISFFYAPAFYEYSYNQRRLNATKFILQRWFSQLKTKFYSSLQKHVEIAVLRNTQQILTLSKFSINQIKTMYADELVEKVIPVHAGIDTKRFHPPERKIHVRHKLQLPRKGNIFFTVRNLMPRMGLENLINAARILRHMFPEKPFHLYIGGKGPFYQKLQQQINRLNLADCVYLLGFISDADLPLYYQAADFFVLPTEALEGFGIVTLESLASNTPVIGTPVGATPEILTRFGGFLTESAAAEDIAASMEYVLRCKDEILANWDSRTLVEADYAWPVVAGRIEAVLQDVIDK